MSIELGIIGAGNMAEAIARAVLAAGLLAPEQIVAADVSSVRRERFSGELGIRGVQDNRQLAGQARMLLLSIKPQQMAPVLAEIGPVMSDQTLTVSIAAGISTQFIERGLGPGEAWRVIRAMPNTPMLVGQGMAALSRGAHANEADLLRARRLFESAAQTIEVPEEQLDAVTAVSGSGPAYVFFLVEQMIQAGIELGLSAEHARTLATRTAIGAAKMLTDSGKSVQELRRMVTSPGGTTQAAIEFMQRHNWPAATVEAIKAAARRAQELAS